MFSILVVDDEVWSRKSICKLIEQLDVSKEVTVCWEAKNGEEAILCIECFKPNIVITDMQMTGLDGQAILEYIHENHLATKVIVISGFTDYSYMKSAITHNAFDYILKPVTPKDLESALTKTIISLKNDIKGQLHVYYQVEHVKIKREIFLQDLSYGRIANPIDAHKHLGELTISYELREFRLITIACREFLHLTNTKFQGNIDLCIYSIENIVFEVVKDFNITLLYKTEDKTKICIVCPTTCLKEIDIRHLVSSIDKAVYSVFRSHPLFGISEIHSNFSMLYTAFNDAISKLFQNPLFNIDVTNYHFEKAKKDLSIFSSYDQRLLLQAFESKSLNRVNDCLNQFLEKVKASPQIKLNEIHHDLTKLVMALAQYIPHVNTPLSPLFDIKGITNILSYDQLETYVRALSGSCVQFIQQETTPQSVKTIKDITEYLKNNYFIDLSLVEIAFQYNFEPTYLSKLFKSVTNENFSEYLTRLRIEKSVELLKGSDLTINEISNLVGYQNQRYFSQVFKKYTGFTPSIYRESLGNPNSLTDYSS